MDWLQFCNGKTHQYLESVQIFSISQISCDHYHRNDDSRLWSGSIRSGRILWRAQIRNQVRISRYYRHLRPYLRTVDVCVCLWSFCWQVSLPQWCNSKFVFVGPTFGGFLYDAVTFRWAIFLIVIGELLSLIGLVIFLVYDVCTAHKREYTRSVQETKVPQVHTCRWLWILNPIVKDG